MTDFVGVFPSVINTLTTLTPYVMATEQSAGVGPGLGCVSNGTNVACSYQTSTQYPNALVYYNADGSVAWKSAPGDLDSLTWASAPIIQSDGSVVIGDDVNIIKYNYDGTKAWTVSTPPGSGPPISLVSTSLGQIISATSNTSNSAPIAVYSGITGSAAKLAASLVLQGPNGSYYYTVNTPCMNNGHHPHRVYVSTQLSTDASQGALWALEVDTQNTISPITPVWAAPFTFAGPSGASPLCVGDNIYFDGAGYGPESSPQTTIFGLRDTALATGQSPTLMFYQALGTTEPITCNFALDPRPEGGFWHQVKHDPHIYHRDYKTGKVIESLDVNQLLLAHGASPPPTGANYWMRGVFTTYGVIQNSTSASPYMFVSESDYFGQSFNVPGNTASYLVLLNLANISNPLADPFVWALNFYPNLSTDFLDTPEGAAVLVMNNGQPVVVSAAAGSGAYFIAMQ